MFAKNGLYPPIEESYTFDPATDFCLDLPEIALTLDSFGYDSSFIQDYPSPFAISSPFQIMSDIGLSKVLQTVNALRPSAIYSSNNGPGVIRGGAYKSSFIRQMLCSSTLIEHCSKIVNAALKPTLLGHQMCHINVEPLRPSHFVGGWHLDQNSYVLVMNLELSGCSGGGDFEYIRTTRMEALGVASSTKDHASSNLIESFSIAPGEAVLMQGSAVIHRAQPLLLSALDNPRRVTLVCSFEPNGVWKDQNAQDFLDSGYADTEDGYKELLMRHGELALHKLGRIEQIITKFQADCGWETSAEDVCDFLRLISNESLSAMNTIRSGDVDPLVALSRYVTSPSLNSRAAGGPRD